MTEINLTRTSSSSEEQNDKNVENLDKKALNLD